MPAPDAPPPAPAPPEATPAAYLSNLAALYRRDVELAARIEALPFARMAPLESARDGHATARVLADDGQTIYVHSRHRPLEEARGLIAEHRAENPLFVLCGLGLGHHVAAIEARGDRPIVIALEDDLALVKAALCLHDFGRMIIEGRLLLLTRAERPYVHERLTPYLAELLLGVQLVALPYARRRSVEFQRAAQQRLTEFVSYSRLQIVTLMKVNRTTFRNVTFNLPDYLRNPGVDALRNRAAGLPAVVVAAGPSLARQLPRLAALRPRAVLVAVQTVYKLLRSVGAAPHFVTSLDYHDVSAEFFEGVGEAGDSILVAEPKVAWRVLEVYPGRRHVLTHAVYPRLLGGLDPRRGGLRAGSTVAHLAFYLAQHLGCDPIILVGQDLCFSEGLFYPPGTPIEDIWRCELGRFQTVEMKQWERIVRNRPILRTVRDVHGRDAYTDDLLYNYAEQFQADFAACPARVIHAGEAGMRLAGTEVMTLAEADERYCTRELPSGLFDVPPPEPPPVGAVCAAIEARIAEVERVRAIAEETSTLLERLTALVDRPEQFNREMARMDELRTLVQRYEDTYQLVVDVSSAAELRRYGADRRLGAVERETAQTARRRLERDRGFVREFLDGCAFLAQTLPLALARVRERLP